MRLEAGLFEMIKNRRPQGLPLRLDIYSTLHKFGSLARKMSMDPRDRISNRVNKLF